MTNNELFIKRLTLLNIPLLFEGNQLPDKLKAKLMIMRVAYDKAVNSFEDDMKEVLKNLKKEGYDERAQKIHRMKEIDGKEDATKEEKKEADEIRGTEEEFNKETETLNKDYSTAYQQKLEDKSDMKPKFLSIEDYTDIIAMIGTEGIIKIKWTSPDLIEVNKEEFLSMIANCLVCE